jgi:tetratricopeptide (TPR) repeat protein
MRFSASLSRGALILLALALTGCLPSAQSQSYEEREPHFLAGKSRASALDYRGAVQSFEKALEANPQSSAAHFELAWIFDQKEADPAAAIYHYDHYLQLRPSADNAEVVKQRILACKQELARTVVLGPVSDKVQKELEQLAQENKKLTEENKRLHEDLDKWIGYAAQLQRLTNRPAMTTRSAPQELAGAARPGPAANGSLSSEHKPAVVLAAVGRTHTIRPGETPSLIAKRYGIKLETLMAANPKVDPRRLQVGQNLLIPTS